MLFDVEDQLKITAIEGEQKPINGQTNYRQSADENNVLPCQNYIPAYFD